MKFYMVEITSYEKKIKKHLSFLGFVRVENKYKQEFATKEEADAMCNLLDTYNISYLEYPNGIVRSNDYRKKFYQKIKPIIGSWYFCAYCGKPIKEEALTVDHILSIRKAQKSKFLQWILLKMNLDDINDSKNLCACCKKCNQKKGQKVSAAYVVRGILSRKRWFWITYYLLILIIIIWVIYNIGNI